MFSLTQKIVPFSVFISLLLSGCSSGPDGVRRSGEYSFYDSTQSFIALTDTRRSGAVVDKGVFYPKNTFAYTYRYCSDNPRQAAKDIAEYQALAKRVCDTNSGQLISQASGTWCVLAANTPNEQPLFSAKITSTALWADLCLDGPFVTLRLNENTQASQSQWYESAQVLGYEPYSPLRELAPGTAITQAINQPASPATAPWGDESQYIYSHIGTTVCLYDHPHQTNLGHTYRGQVFSVNDGLVKVSVKEKFKGDIRTAPMREKVNWHRTSYITAPANSWFVCS
ncbi:hypothetical protein PTW35_24890 (plasmid) [Photobacterium sp. DA100]|uniref:hypothetical protein n=1 Tax=Photobacterium sp. DA100 TaxID=3027472 RepID=UPI00247A0CC3|nr:hypothetical protein [Photobacterium sp. DA100]WEM44509.1 hypothetical protein PTW35_24890 [Photobacterium sp. DA100]